MGRFSPAVLGLLVANILVFVVSLAPGMGPTMNTWFDLWFISNPHFAWWQFASSMFMHATVGHIFFNMFALATFALPLERIWGTRRFLEFYFICGLGAAAIYAMVNGVQFAALKGHLIDSGVPSADITGMLASGSYAPTVQTVVQRAWTLALYKIFASHMLGASGAIYGVLVAFGFTYPNVKLSLMFFPVGIAAKYFIPGLVLLDLFSGVTGISIFGGGVAHFAHIGGAIIGFALMGWWRRRTRATETAFNTPH